MTAPMILLHPDDNVFVACRSIRAGETLAIDGTTVAAPAAVDVGHKLARRALKPGDKVIKYGAPIGSVVTAVAQAGHVHTHNMRSDYLPSPGESA